MIVHRGDLKHNAEAIEKILDDNEIKAHVKNINCGPTVTQYILEVFDEKKLPQIASLSNDLALATNSSNGFVRIVAPFTEKTSVAIEITNKKPEYFTLRTMIEGYLQSKLKYKLPVMVGIDPSEKQWFADLADLKHILIAGATGSGKSIFENSLIVSLMLLAAKDEVKFLMVDPKRVELTIYNGSPFLLGKVLLDADETVENLELLVKEGEQRLKISKKQRNYPQIIVVIDEFSDIMIFGPVKTEKLIIKLLQMDSAAGIHIICSTSRPSTDVYTKQITKNFPTKLIANTASSIDSKVTLGMEGAEKLSGRGDMLYLPPDQDKPIRLQVPLITEREIVEINNHFKK